MGKKIQFIGRYALEGHLLGKGSFARVELAHHSVTGCKVAIKIIDTRKLKEEYQKNNLHREARILGQLRHPNIARLYETLKATTLHCLVLEYASGGELQAFIKLQKDFRLSEDRGRPYIRQLVSALHYLHERGVAHRDLKMENIMLDTPKINIKLIDFGLSNTFSKDELMKTHCGSPEYAAPELFTAGEKYGLEIDIWSLGIVIYAMLVGKLPFTTPYTDQYRRQKLVQQMEKGLVEVHKQEMSHLSTDCQDLLHKVIEPSPSLRLLLLDMEIHPWFTENAKKPFIPFQNFPRDKVMKTQTYEELATALNMRKEVLEQKVAENKSDELSAMFNMILDRKRQQQGIFDVDHTIKSSEKKETKGKRSKSAHAKNEKSGDKKHVHKGPPALILPSDDTAAESAPHSGNEPDHETKFSSFDFLALCSTPTWLGPERRKSRRRSRSPMPSPHVIQHGSQGDYMERQEREMEREMIKEERAATAGLLSPTQDSRQQNNSHQYNDHHTPVSTSLSVPGSDSAPSYQNSFRRSSSFKLSRRRAQSCGPSQRRKSLFQHSGSIDHHADKGGVSLLSAMLASTKDGRSSPAIAGEVPLHRGVTKTASLKIRRNSTSGSRRMAAHRKQSVDFVDTSSKSYLGVPNNDAHKNNLLTVPPLGSNNNLQKVPEVELEGRNLLHVPNIDMGSNPLLCVPNHGSLDHPADSTLLLPSGSKMQSATRPGKLTLIECYSPPKENSKLNSQLLLPIIKPLISGANGPLTSVEVHYTDSSKPSSSADLHIFQKKDASDVLYNAIEQLTESKRQESLHGSINKQAPSEILFDTRSQKKYQKLSLLETSATSFPPYLRPPPASKSTILNTSSQLEEGAIAMQIEEKSNVFYNSNENRLLCGAEGSLLDIKDGLADLQHHFDGLILSSEYVEENEDRVDSMTELISDSFRDEVLANAKPSITSPVSYSDTQKVSRLSSAASPDDDLIMKGSGSVASFSKSSGSGRKPGGGKAKSPTTPTWLNLRTPLARIESFHSDDFECFADSDNDEQESTSSMSATTPTVPCFAYKLHVMKKKQTKLKSSGSSKQSGCGCSSIQNSDFLSSKLNRNSVDKKRASIASGHARLDAAVTDPLLSSSSETEHHEEGRERLIAPGQSKIHPMGADDRDANEVMSKPDTKCLFYHNAITSQPNQIKNAVNKFPKIVPEYEQGTKKRAFVKHLAWRKSFAQFLKRKRYHSPLVTSTPQQQQQQNQQIHRHHRQSQQIHQQHQQQRSPGNNNNNDLVPTDSLPESRNGILALGQLQTKTMDISTGTEENTVTIQEGEHFKVAASTLSQVPVENIVTELIELQSSPKLQCPPSPSRAFDFSLATDSPKMKSSCLQGWGTCRECGREDISSEEDNEFVTTVDPTAVTFNLKPMGENNVQGNISCPQIYKLSST